MPLKSGFSDGLGGVGNASLEIFMLHAIPMMLIEKNHWEFEHHNFVMLSICIAVILLGIFIHNGYDFLNNKIKVFLLKW